MRFGDFEYSRERGELHFRGERVPLQEQPQRLLGLLLERPGEIVSREHIRKALWSRRHGDHEHGINTAVRKLRRVLEGSKSNEVRIVTSAGQGYRLLLPATRAQAPVPPPPIHANLFPKTDPVGQEAFTTGRFLFSQRNPKSLFAAKAQFELACERIPDFALAHASLSRTCRFLTIFEASDPGPLWEQAERHALRAVELDSHSSEAQSSLACVLARYRWQWGAGCAAYERALQLNPNDAETCCDYGVALLAMGRYDEGARVLDRVLVLDPRYAVGRATVALGWMMGGRQQEAVAMLTGMTEAMPDFLTPYIYLGIEQLNMACWPQAEATFKRSLALAPGNPTFLSLMALAYAGQGRRLLACEVATQLDALGKERYVSPTARLLAAMAAEDHASATAAITRTVSERDANFALYRKMRALDPVRQSPEFIAALEAMNLPDRSS